MTTGFNLEHDPFPISTTARPYLRLPTYERCLDQLSVWLANRVNLVLLTGESGSGKSTLLAELSRRIQSDCSTTWIRADTDSEESLRRAIRTHVDSDRRTVVGQHHSMVAPRAVVVDDAEKLSSDTLKWLLNLGDDSEEDRPAILLAGSALLIDQLKAASVNRKGGHARWLKVPLLGFSEVGDYVHLRLYDARLTGDSPFTPEAIAEIYNSAGGRPGAINHAARSFLSKIRPSRAQGRKLSAALATVLLLGVGAFVGWQHTVERLFSSVPVSIGQVMDFASAVRACAEHDSASDSPSKASCLLGEVDS